MILSKGFAPQQSLGSQMDHSSLEVRRLFNMLHSSPNQARWGLLLLSVFKKPLISGNGIIMWTSGTSLTSIRGTLDNCQMQNSFQKTAGHQLHLQHSLSNEVTLNILIVHGRISWYEYLIMQGKHK